MRYVVMFLAKKLAGVSQDDVFGCGENIRARKYR